jgi:chemotaxis protein methyltransferase CheR
MNAGAEESETALLRSYSFSDQQFERVRGLVRQHLGIALVGSKRELVYGRLSRRLRRLQLTSFDDYLARIEAGDAAELEQFCNAITTNLTAFFREQHHFDFLASLLLPQLAITNRASRRIRIWSAGCSTGEEPYSLAMVVRETLGHLRQWDIRILATDIDSNVLAHAQSGVYGGERLEKVESARILRWFERVDGTKQYQVRDDLKSLIAFRPLNLMSGWPMSGPFDLIVCRNVLIYFDRDTQRQLVERMGALQRPGDHLIIGHSESLLSVTNQYEVVGQTIHRKRPS